jgi:hypothetical protein
MQTETIDESQLDVGLQAKSPEPDQHILALTELEAEVVKLDAAFIELSNLESQQQELEYAFVQVCEDEKLILTDSGATEAQSVKKLVECRARKDIRAERLAAHKKRVANHRDLITFDISPVLRRAFANYAHGLLARKEAEMSELFYNLLPSGSLPGIDNRQLVEASSPVTKIRQVFNWTHNQPRQDQEQELTELKELPHKWLVALRRLIQGEDPFGSS